MPKKFVGENSKAAAAKARKNEKADAEKAKKDKELEDAKWADDNKQLAKKQARKEDAERKRLEALAKKKEREELAAAEDAAVTSAVAASKKTSGLAAVKLTRAQIQAETEKREAAARGNKPAAVETHLDKPLEENLNRTDPEIVTASNVEDAIAALSVKDEVAVDKHPEKRMKAAYEAFEKERLPQLKAEKSNMRLSQLKQIMKKEWMKHPDNPLNQRLAAMRANQ